jgi:hypothetical protein
MIVAARSIRKSKSLVAKSVELAVATPRVVAHRATRAALAGPHLSNRDRKEFRMMVAEKRVAFMQSWSAMAAQMVRSNQALTAAMLRSSLTPFTYSRHSAANMSKLLQSAAIGVLAAGLAPVHRKAVANARRLARTKLR